MKLPFESPQGDLGSGVFHAEANIEVRLGSVALSAFGADCGCPCARVPLFADYGRSTRVFYSEAHGTKAMVMPNVSGRGENVLELIRQDHEAFAPNQMSLHGLAKTAETNLVNR